jgi:hypothetical protein
LPFGPFKIADGPDSIFPPVYGSHTQKYKLRLGRNRAPLITNDPSVGWHLFPIDRRVPILLPRRFAKPSLNLFFRRPCRDFLKGIFGRQSRFDLDQIPNVGADFSLI